jgi:glyoxylase-like metal-dependent hydrolase (beta-lactamase superfamily II)
VPNNERLSRRGFLAGAAGVTALCACSLPARLVAQPQQGSVSVADWGKLKWLQTQGANVLALAGEGGAVLVDGGPAATAAELTRAALAATGTERIALLVNTHWHPEQIGANELVGRAGGKILAHEKTRQFLSHKTYKMLAIGRFEAVAPLPEVARPNEPVRGEGSLEAAGVPIEYGYLPAAHTDGDLFVHFPAQNVLAAGGVVSAEHWPLLDYRSGAWFGGRVRALQRLADLVKPDTRVVPAEGKLMTGADVKRQRAIYDELFETLIGYMNKGFGAEDAVAANPLARYESEFGSAAAFLDGAYRSMLIAYVPE